MKLVFCVESSYDRGMGHLYRSMRLAQDFLKFNPHISITFLVNNDARSIELLKENKITCCTLDNFQTKNWEEEFLSNNYADIWINDRLDTSLEHVQKIARKVKKIVTFDDRGEGASLVDINFSPLIFGEPLKGKRIRSGTEYLILDQNLKNYRRHRKIVKNILISLGGSDNYLLTLEVLKVLNTEKYKATVLLGPLNSQEETIRNLYPNLIIKKNVENLGELFKEQDLFISGGGMMPFEALSTGLPVLCCASEEFEIPVCQFMESLGCAKYLGFRDEIKSSSVDCILNQIAMNITSYSDTALSAMNFSASAKIYNDIFEEIQ